MNFESFRLNLDQVKLNSIKTVHASNLEISGLDQFGSPGRNDFEGPLMAPWDAYQER